MTAALAAAGVALRADDLIRLRMVTPKGSDAVALASLPGGFVTRKRGHGQETADVREYVDGDDIRHLDRGSTARTGRLHVRSFQKEKDRVTLLVADFRPSMLWGTRRALCSVAAAEALAVIGWQVVDDGGRVGLLAIGAGAPVAVTARGRAAGMLAVIGGLVRAHDAALRLAREGRRDGGRGDVPLDAALAGATRLAPQGGAVVIASGFDAPGPGLADQLGRISQRRALWLISVMDGGTENLAPGVYPVRLPDGSRRRLRITGRGPTSAAEDEVAGFPATRVTADRPASEFAVVLKTAFAGRRDR